MFSFSPTEDRFDNWVTWAQRGSCQASGVFIVPGRQITAQGSDPRGVAPMRPFKVQLFDESVQKPRFPRKSKVLR